MSELERRDYIIPLRAESLVVERRTVVGDTVRIDTVTDFRDHDVDEELIDERVEVARVAINRAVETMPEIRHEGDLIIVPVVEEQIVVTRRLVLTEEVHIRRTRTARRHQETVVLREQRAVVTRNAAPGDTSLATSTQET